MTRCLTLCALLCSLAVAAAPDAGTPAAPTFKNPVVITADKLEMQNKKGQAVYTGNVRAVRGTTLLRCGRLVATWGAGREVTQVECLNGAELTDKDRWAKGDKAVMDTQKNLVVLTGSPEMKQGPNHMKGERVLWDLDKDTIDVEHPVATFDLASPSTRKSKAPKPP